MIGIPGNVVQSRFSTNEEWEAVPGYHHSNSAKIAFSDDSASWSEKNGWPVKNNSGVSIFKSNQDSYCVYSDSNNQRGILGITIVQTGYVFTQTGLTDVIFFKFQVTSTSNPILNNLFFSLYADIDVGDVTDGEPEWGDDKIGFHKDLNLMYFYDADNFSSEWPGEKPGSMGISIISTPTTDNLKNGVTDFHYSLYDYDKDMDTVQYGIMSSAQSLFQSSDKDKYFHLLPTNTNLHFDDVETIPNSGMDILALIGSGPYTLHKGDTLTFITAIIGGPDTAAVISTASKARTFVNADFTTDIHRIAQILPDRNILVQNYPNPFNPTTMISYQLSTTNQVSLKVYDLLGREVTELVNEIKKAGRYSVQWNAMQYSSGIYFATMRAGSFTTTKKLLLMK